MSYFELSKPEYFLSCTLTQQQILFNVEWHSPRMKLTCDLTRQTCPQNIMVLYGSLRGIYQYLKIAGDSLRYDHQNRQIVFQDVIGRKRRVFDIKLTQIRQKTVVQLLEEQRIAKKDTVKEKKLKCKQILKQVNRIKAIHADLALDMEGLLYQKEAIQGRLEDNKRKLAELEVKCCKRNNILRFLNRQKYIPLQIQIQL